MGKYGSYPHRSEIDLKVGRAMFYICLTAVFLTLGMMLYIENRGAAPVAEVPEYKIEPQTTLTARP